MARRPHVPTGLDPIGSGTEYDDWYVGANGYFADNYGVTGTWSYETVGDTFEFTLAYNPSVQCETYSGTLPQPGSTRSRPQEHSAGASQVRGTRTVR
jgi:hypothetical protein